MNERSLDFTAPLRTIRTVVLFVLLMPVLLACPEKTPSPQKPPVPVTAGTVAQKTVPLQLRAVGNVEAYSTVSVKSQIGGILIRVHFREGQDVNKGDLLFSIDPRPYEAALKQAEANLAKDIAQLDNARKEVRRYSELAKKGYVAQEQYDQLSTNAASFEAIVNAAMAVVENARLQLKYCSIYAPISGRTGNLMADEGNLIKANADTAMVVINQVQPIYVSFTVPEKYLGDIKKYMSSGKLNVALVIGRDEDYPESGVVTFLDNAVDAATGTIQLKATFSNRQRLLWPGQFVAVTMTLTSNPNAIVVPSQAIQTGQEGLYVFVIKADLTVESRTIVTGLSLADETVVEKGLQPGERVVTDGQMRLFPGARVDVKAPIVPGDSTP